MTGDKCRYRAEPRSDAERWPKWDGPGDLPFLPPREKFSRYGGWVPRLRWVRRPWRARR